MSKLKYIFIILIMLGQVASAQHLSTVEYDKAGRVLTLNKMGWMHPVIDSVTAKFLVQCDNHKNLKILEIGAAYGYASMAALERGAQVYINDLDNRHLEIFRDNIKNKDLLSKVTLLPGNFPEEINLRKDFFDAILAVRVLHFFAPNKLEEAAIKIYQSLKKGGKVYIVAETPYLGNWSKYIPVYNQKKADGDLYPGYFTNLSDYNATNAQHLPKALHFLDPQVLTRVFTHAGFDVDMAVFLDRQDFPENMRLDGRESVGFIATKK